MNPPPLPLQLFALPALALQGWGYRLPLPRLLLRALSSPASWIGLLAAYWLARNLPRWPYTWLAPG